MSSRCRTADPIDALLDIGAPGVLTAIVGIDGPSYRPLGAMMAVQGNGEKVGMLSSGCIEADVVRHSLDALESGRIVILRYGAGSPFFDIQLPCGGGMDILIVPKPDLHVLRKVQEYRRNRQDCTLEIDISNGDMSVSSIGSTGLAAERFLVRFEPELQFFVFGKGPEASTFAKLVQSVGFPNMLMSPDSGTLESAAVSGCETRMMFGPTFPDDLVVDRRTAVILFFHDHDWEPPILIDVLATDAFYIGAQGSARAMRMRAAALDALEVGQDQIARLKGPVGLIPSARDATILALSVLAEVLAQSMPGRRS